LYKEKQNWKILLLSSDNVKHHGFKLGVSPNWNGGMLEYWNDGYWNFVWMGKWPAKSGTMIKFAMDYILKPTIPSFHYSIIP